MNNIFYYAPSFAKSFGGHGKATKNRYFSSLLCITILAFAPACNKQKSVSQKDTKKLIELDNTIFEIEEFDADNDQKSITKF